MSTFGQQAITTVGRTPKVTADGTPMMKHAGVTIDWGTVAAVSGADVEIADGFVAKIGEKYLRYGQVLTRITTGGKYGPYDPDALDGRQTLTHGSCFVLNETVKENDRASDHPPVLYGGLVFRDRVLAHATTDTLAGGPPLADLLAVMPNLQLVTD